MADPGAPPPPTAPRFRHTLIRVMSMQIGTLLLLALLQLRYAR